MRYLPFFLLFFLACSEIPPVITPAQPGGSGSGSTSVDDQKRQVIIEEFTGIRCVACPAGSAALEDLLAIHGDQLVAVSIHSGFFSSPPHSNTSDNFLTDAGDQILSFLGEPLGYPSAVVNRTPLNGELQQPLGDWAGSIVNELQQEPQVKIDLQTDYSDAGGQLEIGVTLFGQDNLTDGDNLSVTVLILESGIADPQTTPDGVQDDYVHKHVLREAVSNATGDPLTETLTAGTQITVDYELNLNPNYDPTKTSVVAYVHRAEGTKEVLQAIEQKIQ